MRRAAVTSLFIFAVTLLTHLTYEFLSNADFFYPDSYTYLVPALNMLHGAGFTGEEGPETLRTPGYPLFLVPFLALRLSPAVIVAANHSLDALLAAAVYLLARRNGARRWMAVAAALILAFDTITIHYANKVLTETLSAVLILVVLVLVRDRRSILPLVLAGLLCGGLVLVRPVAVAYSLVLLAWLAWTGVRPIVLAAFLLAAIAPPVAWASRNGARTGVVTLSSIGAINLLSYRAAAALALEDGGDFPTRLLVHQRELNAAVSRLVIAAEGVESADELSSAELAPYLSAVARPILLQHPRGVILMTLRGLLVNMSRSDWDALAEVVDDEWIPEQVTRIAIRAWTGLVWIGAVGGLLMLWRRDRAQAALIALSVFYFLFMAAGGEAEGRFRVPIIPLLALAVASIHTTEPWGDRDRA